MSLVTLRMKGLAMNIWWCNQTRCWEQESKADVVRAPDPMERLTYRETVNLVRKGDIIIHYRKPHIYALSRAKEDGHHKATLPDGYWSGWEFKTEYCFLPDPIHREDVRDKLTSYADRHYAINANGWVKQGYFLSFDIRGLKVVMSRIPQDKRPDWLKSI